MSGAPRPTFLLIGAQKAGTTWISAMLRAHPEVFVPRAKELHYFNLKENHARGMDWYLGQFGEYAGQKAIGERRGAAAGSAPSSSRTIPSSTATSPSWCGASCRRCS